ncbi:MAG: hypothetical protein KAS32_18175 [Candidatus Peribacteraceae bacterium]|nr:hypothetical protein [Candidatus Peribacteraceae bacterium]
MPKAKTKNKTNAKKVSAPKEEVTNFCTSGPVPSYNIVPIEEVKVAYEPIMFRVPNDAINYNAKPFLKKGAVTEAQQKAFDDCVAAGYRIESFQRNNNASYFLMVKND